MAVVGSDVKNDWKGLLEEQLKLVRGCIAASDVINLTEPTSVDTEVSNRDVTDEWCVTSAYTVIEK